MSENSERICVHENVYNFGEPDECYKCNNHTIYSPVIYTRCTSENSDCFEESKGDIHQYRKKEFNPTLYWSCCNLPRRQCGICGVDLYDGSFYKEHKCIHCYRGEERSLAMWGLTHDIPICPHCPVKKEIEKLQQSKISGILW